MTRTEVPKPDAPCRLGYEEHDGSAYCHEHGGFVAYAAGSRTCNDTARRRVVIPSSELPGMWERADFEGGLDEVRGPDWTRPIPPGGSNA
jgi:hypothetical protein